MRPVPTERKPLARDCRVVLLETVRLVVEALVEVMAVVLAYAICEVDEACIPTVKFMTVEVALVLTP